MLTFHSYQLYTGLLIDQFHHCIAVMTVKSTPCISINQIYIISNTVSYSYLYSDRCWNENMHSFVESLTTYGQHYIFYFSYLCCSDHFIHPLLPNSITLPPTQSSPRCHQANQVHTCLESILRWQDLRPPWRSAVQPVPSERLLRDGGQEVGGLCVRLWRHPLPPADPLSRGWCSWPQVTRAVNKISR